MDLAIIADRWGHLLNSEQQDLVQAFVVTRSVSAAAEMAGLTPVQASKYLKSPTIQAAIKFCEKALRENVSITPEEVISDLRLMRDMAFGRIPVPETKWVNGEPVTHYVRNYNPNAANKAIENLGRVVGMFTDKKEISLPASEAQLKKRLEDILGVSLDDVIDGEFVETVPEPGIPEAMPESLAQMLETVKDDELTNLLAAACDEHERS